jgi:cysteine-rich repeat protein
MCQGIGKAAAALAAALLLALVSASQAGAGTVTSGACCYGSTCSDLDQASCDSILVGGYKGDGTACTNPGICIDCGSGCVDFGETCDDANTADGDGCSASCQEETCFGCTEPPIIGCSIAGPNGSFVRCDQADVGVQANVVVNCSGPSTCEPVVSQQCVVCGDGTCDTQFKEDCSTCPDDCGTCPTGACCYGALCSDTTEALCDGEFLGGYQGDGSSCTEPGICIDCGSGCIDYGETCDDANTADGDGCNSKCQEEACFTCNEPLPGNCSSASGVVPTACTVIGPVCSGPSTCDATTGIGCATCGDGTVDAGETCDDANTVNGDCCSANCQVEIAGTPCPDNQFCDGVETCDGAGLCVGAQAPADCSGLTSECGLGVCDVELNHCVVDPNGKDGDACTDENACTVAGSGVCTDGTCVGQGTTLSPSCRWILVAGSPDGPVKYVNGEGSMMDANACGDTAKSAGVTTASLVTTAAAASPGDAIFFYGPPEVAGDIVTGGDSVASNLYITIPGTSQKTVAAGTTLAKVPAGIVDATGSHPLVDVCKDDQAALALAAPILDAMPRTQPLLGTNAGLKVPSGASARIKVTGFGVSVLQTAALKVAHGATLTLEGNATDVVMLRISAGRLTFGYGSQLILDGLLPQNVLLYSQNTRCRLSPGVVGAGTMFCPKANKYVVGVGTAWTGTFLGGAGSKTVQVRLGAQLTHAPFTGF